MRVMDAATEYLSDYACRLTYEDLSPETAHQVMRTLVDTLGCGIGAFDGSFREEPMISISADLTVGGWTLEAILRERIWSRSRYATVTAGVLRSAGYLLLPTFATPHYDVVLPEATEMAARALLAHFGPVLDNPYKRRR